MKKLLAIERKYLMKLLEAEAERFNAPMGKVMADWYACPNRTDSELKYRDRLAKAKLNKARIVAGIISKVNDCE